MRLSRPAPAKINLYLRVLGRRLDGLHEIDSVLLPLALADEVRLELTLDRPTTVTCRCPERPDLDGTDNLAARAARRYLELTGRAATVEIELHKRIWVAAGLGGGSSDAAAVLLLLDETLGPIPWQALAELAAGLGADVPFFLGNRPARVRGTGEQVSSLPTRLPALPLVLANPGIPLATASVYAGLGLQPGQNTGQTPVEQSCLARLPEGLLDLIDNDLAEVAERLCPVVAELRRRLLDAGALVACLTGSGPTVFGVFDAPGRARAAAQALGMSGFSALDTTTASA